MRACRLETRPWTQAKQIYEEQQEAAYVGSGQQVAKIEYTFVMHLDLRRQALEHYSSKYRWVLCPPSVLPPLCPCSRFCLLISPSPSALTLHSLCTGSARQ